jgi:hypothetical protein
MCGGQWFARTVEFEEVFQRMKINLVPYAFSWGVLAITVVVLALYRRAVASQEDNSLHLEAEISGNQLANKLEIVDKWGRGLTVTALLWGLALSAMYLYQVWITVPAY